MRDLINIVENYALTEARVSKAEEFIEKAADDPASNLPINVGGVDEPEFWSTTAAPADANPEDVADMIGRWHSGYDSHAEIGMVGGHRAWIVSREDGQEENPDWWVMGRCIEFAQAMNRIYSVPIWAWMEKNISAAEEGVTDPYELYKVFHAFVVVGDYAVDERGAKLLKSYTKDDGKVIRSPNRFFSDDRCVHETRPVTIQELGLIHDDETHGSMAAVRHILARKAFYDKLVARCLAKSTKVPG